MRNWVVVAMVFLLSSGVFAYDYSEYNWETYNGINMLVHLQGAIG